MPRIGVALPTIPGREASLTRAVDSLNQTEGAEVVIEVVENSRSSGWGWQQGAERLDADFLLCFNDDCEVITPDWWVDAAKTCEEGLIPAPVVYNTDGSLQSAGGQLGAESDLLKDVEDRKPVGFTTIPFVSWEQYEAIGLIDTHYCSDCWVSEKGRQLGYETILRTGFEVVHHMHSVGRTGDANADRAIMQRAL